jgi:hypothetical protein
MNNIDLNTMTRDFLAGRINESRYSTDVWTYLHGVTEALKTISPRTMAGNRKVNLALDHMRHVRSHTRKLEERVKVLEEQITVLEEGI